jgi:hypothetical protein
MRKLIVMLRKCGLSDLKDVMSYSLYHIQLVESP